MGKNNNKLLSLFLLASIVATTSIFSGILSISKERYERSEAVAASYKTVYLYVPNNVTKSDGTGEIKWNTDDTKVTFYTPTKPFRDDSPYPGAQMLKIDTNLYAFTLSDDYLTFIFTTTVGGNRYRSQFDGGTMYSYSDIDLSEPMITMQYYNVSGPANVGSKSNPAATDKPLHSASAYANAFVKVLRNDPCKGDGSSDYLKVKDVWKGLEAIYTGLDSSDKLTLQNASIEGEDITNQFAALYDHIYHRYGNYDGFGTNFAGRSVSALPASRYTPISISEMDTSNLIIAISSGLAVISITGLYFYIRKRKQD